MTKRNGLFSRREMLVSSALAPLALSAGPAVAQQAASAPALYQLSINIEIMFPRDMGRDERMKQVAAMGEKAFSFWRASEEEQNKMLDIQQQTGLKCGSVSGYGPGAGYSAPRGAAGGPGGGRGGPGGAPGGARGGAPGGAPGWAASPGPSPMKPGSEKAFVDDITIYAKMAQKFGGADAILLFSGREPDIPWDTQRAVLMNNLRSAAEVGAKYNIVFAWERPHSSAGSTAEAYAMLEEVKIPNLKFDFDIALQQMADGNIIANMRTGFQKGLIQLIEMGDVPGRTEIGLGELNYVNIFKAIRVAGYKGWIGTEHSASTMTPAQAVALDRKLAFPVSF
jgi:hydroxypyruvate isomerase